MKLEMTLREALEIQTKQVAHYLRHNPRLPEIVAAKTDVSGVDLDTPIRSRRYDRHHRDEET